MKLREVLLYCCTEKIKYDYILTKKNDSMDFMDVMWVSPQQNKIQPLIYS